MLSKQNIGYKDNEKSDKGIRSVDQIEAVDQSIEPEVDALLPLGVESDYKNSEVTGISPDVYDLAVAQDNSPLGPSQGDTGIRTDDPYPVASASIHGSSLTENSQLSMDATILVNRVANGHYGNYKILEPIGRGGSSEVYKAIRESTKTENPLNSIGIKLVNKAVACKVLLDRLLDKKDHYKRFMNEANVAQHLDHQNIIKVHDAGEVGGRPFLILDYLEGVALSDTYDKKGGLPIDRALPIFLQISEAFSYAHARNVIHRDLKPSNIMLVTKEDSSDFVKVVDFGIAKIKSEATVASTKLTKTGEMFGTPIYMSPEQCKGELVEATSDIYSFGILMYEVLTGHPPFEGKDYLTLFYKHTTELPESIKDIDPDIRLSQRIENIIFKCLEKVPAARYQKMDEVKHDLECAIASGASGSKLIAELNRSLSQFTRKVNAFLSKPLSARQWLGVLVIAIVLVSLGIWNQLKTEETVAIKSFLKDVPAAQRTIAWVEPEAPPFARNHRLFQDVEDKLITQEKLVKAFGESPTETGFKCKVKIGNFYLDAGALRRADNEFILAEQIATSLRLSDAPETYEQVAELELNMAKCAFKQSEYPGCIVHASKSIELYQTHKNSNYDFFASKVIPAWELIGRAAPAQNNLQLANKAYASVYIPA